MDVATVGPELQDRHNLEALFCRLCGAQDATRRMLHLTDTYSIGANVSSSSIFQLLDGISALLKVQGECEASMSKHVCVACFNTAVDIQAFIDSAVSFQKTTICQLFPNAKLEEVPELPFSVPSQHFSQENGLFECNSVENIIGVNHEKAANNYISNAEGKVQNDNAVEGDVSQLQETEKNQAVREIPPQNDTGYNFITELIDNYEASKSKPCVSITAITPSVPLSSQLIEPPDLQTTRNEYSLSKLNNTSITQLSDTVSNKSLKESKTFSGVAEERIEISTDVVEHSSTAVLEVSESEAEGSDSSKRNPIKKCPTCSKIFHRQSQLKSHLASHSQARPFECQICFMKFKYRRNLVEHSSIHDDLPSFMCSICGLTFKQRSNLLKHERTHENLSKLNYRCNLCNKRYSQSSHLKTHMRNVHGDNCGYKCNQCNAVLQSMSSLRRHTATVHASSSKFSCPHCSKGFNNSQNFQGHIRSHTGERPYCCTTCNKSFTTSKALSRHRLIHQGTKSHRCSQCGKAFLELCDLKRHVKRHLLKKAKNANKKSGGGRIPENAAIAVQGMNSLNLMVLPESFIFSESQQLLDHSGGSPAEIMLQQKLDAVKTVPVEPVLEASMLQDPEATMQQTSGSLAKVPHVLQSDGEALAPSQLLPAAQVLSAQDVGAVPILQDDPVLQPSEEISGISATQLNASTLLQTPSDDVQDSDNSGNNDRQTNEATNGPTGSEAATMVVLSSIGNESEYIPVADHNDVIDSSRHQQSERVLSHATW